jgi:hypothetical protein
MLIFAGSLKMIKELALWRMIQDAYSLRGLVALGCMISRSPGPGKDQK